MSLQQLFHKPLKILVGKSLYEDDEDLYGRLGDLIERRNGLAHKGEVPPDKPEAREHVKTAVEVFRWIDAVEQRGAVETVDSLQ